MNPQTIWTTAAIAHAAFALASLTIGFAFARRVRLQGRAIVLLLALLALTAFFTAASVDALIHINAAAHRGTSWTLAAVLLQTLIAALCLHFYALSASHLLQAVGESKWIARLPWVSGYLLLGITLFRFYAADSSAVWLANGNAIYPPGFFPVFFVSLGVMARHLPNSERTRGLWAVAFRSQLPVDLVTLNLSGREAEALAIPATALDLRSLATAAIPILLVDFLSILFPLAWEPWNLSLYVLVQLAMLPSIAGLIFYQTRATFFDLLIKRGFVLAALCLITIGLANAAPIGAALAIAAMTFTFAWSLLHAELDAFLDRVIFARPDYRRALSTITAGISKATDAGASIDYVTGELATALRADWVRFGESPDPKAQAVATVASSGRHWGILSLGARLRGQPYQSQDATFVDGVAAQLSAALEGFDARAVRQLAAEAEVRALRAQINPHFLFNSLNSLADMVKDSPRTEATVLNLARVFRYALDSTRSAAVPLDDEIRFIESYLQIEQVRFEHRLQFQIDCPQGLRDRQIPPMLIQPLVENAIRHGLAPKVEGGSVSIVAEETEAHVLRITVEDKGVGFDPMKPHTGVGIENVRRRVQSLLNGRFEVVSQPGKGARITLEWNNA